MLYSLVFYIFSQPLTFSPCFPYLLLVSRIFFVYHTFSQYLTFSLLSTYYFGLSQRWSVPTLALILRLSALIVIIIFPLTVTCFWATFIGALFYIRARKYLYCCIFAPGNIWGLLYIRARKYLSSVVYLCKEILDVCFTSVLEYIWALLYIRARKYCICFTYVPRIYFNEIHFFLESLHTGTRNADVQLTSNNTSEPIVGTPGTAPLLPHRCPEVKGLAILVLTVGQVPSCFYEAI